MVSLSSPLILSLSSPLILSLSKDEPRGKSQIRPVP